MRASFKPFIMGIVFTSITWAVVLYFYLCLNPNASNKQQGIPTIIQTFTSSDANLKNKLNESFVKTEMSNYLDSSIENEYIVHHHEKASSVTKSSATSKNTKTKMVAESLEDSLGLVRNEQDKKIREQGYTHHAFNVLVSSRLDYHRAVPDSRHKMCKKQTFPVISLNASIIICFYNEEPHTLYRTVFSVLDRTPSNLLHEILLVDDNSDAENLHVDIQDFVSKNFLSKSVKLLKTPKREGLIRARIFGARSATGKVLLFLDSHCEVNVHWIQPLLSRIQENRTFVVTPIIDIINSDTFQYTASPLVRGGFNWGLHFKWDSLPDGALKKGQNFIQPILSPTMAGGLFAIEREYFFDIGEYDAGMNVWGGENLEISFRIWMCGGRLEIIPCSRVGHVFRRRRPYGSPNGEDTMTYNSLRAAHVWLDDYIEYFFQVRPDARHLSYGDVGQRQRLRRLMQCQSFDWYLKNVYPELTIPGSQVSNNKTTSHNNSKNDVNPRRIYRRKNFIATYKIKLSGTELCIESEKEVTIKGSTLVLGRCSKSKKQMWSVTDKNELILAQMLCLDSPESSLQKPRLSKCHEMGGLQEWKHHDDIDTPIYNMAAGLCLGIPDEHEFPSEVKEKTQIVMNVCTETTAAKWDFIKI